MYKEKLKKLNEWEYEIPKEGEMLVPGKMFSSSALLKETDENALTQVVNVACLPGIQKYSIAMSDMHVGYGFPIGGVGAFDPNEKGIISVGGVGFDINCGCRTLKTDLFLKDVQPKIKELVDELFNSVPAGLGSRGKILVKDLNNVFLEGSRWAVEKGYGTEEDLECTESHGCVDGAVPENVSEIAIRREKRQVGTLGSGNHYLEVQYVDEIYDKETAKAWGLDKNQIVITLHCGSRALGHQIGTDYLKTFADASRKYGIPIREKELVCAPIKSEEGQKYFSAMNCGINYAFANRQVIAHLVRQSFSKVFPGQDVKTLYDVGHNTCKIENHKVDGKMKELYVHRKGATRAFGPGREELPKIYQKTGQPVIIGGTMGTSSYLLVGTSKGEEKAFASCCHGAGRAMSRTQASKTWNGEKVIEDLRKKGIYIKCHSFEGLAEEAPDAYKPVEDVVDSIHFAELARKVCKLKPIGNIKG
ncbi:MAG: RtcB family protein [Candidatus Pacearchaeota archaeon]|nr:RtcB family protein [Candidatus Pacearchaeota archaeon]